MLNFLTGQPEPAANSVNRSFTAEEHLNAMRHLLHAATQSEDQDPALLLAAARVHAEAAKTARRTAMPVKTAPARLSDPAEATPESRVRFSGDGHH